METSSFKVVETVVTVDGMSANTYGIDNGKLRVEGISLDKNLVVNFTNLLNADGNINDREIVLELIDNLLA